MHVSLVMALEETLPPETTWLLAGRKSVHVSRGYGIDLTDVPIFVSL